MNPVERGIRRIDAIQQRYTATAFIVGVAKKYGDDNGGILAGNLTYTSFTAMFPLLLVLTTVLGLIAAADPSVKAQVLNAVASQVPLIGKTLEENVGQLRRNSVIGLIVGLLALIYGCTGLAQAGLFTMEQVWNLPGPERPGFAQRLGRSVLFLALLGADVIGTTLLASLSTYGHNAPGWVVVAEIAAALLNGGMFLGAYRVLTPKVVASRCLVAGAITGGIVYTLLQLLGTYAVHHFVHSDSAYGVFAIVLGLLAWIYLAVRITIYAAEVNVVLARRLWPRSLVQPPLTKADRDSLALQVIQNRRREEEQVEVRFTDHDAPT